MKLQIQLLNIYIMSYTLSCVDIISAPFKYHDKAPIYVYRSEKDIRNEIFSL